MQIKKTTTKSPKPLFNPFGIHAEMDSHCKGGRLCLGRELIRSVSAVKLQLNYQPFILGIVRRIGLFAADAGSYFSSNTRANLSSWS